MKLVGIDGKLHTRDWTHEALLKELVYASCLLTAGLSVCILLVAGMAREFGLGQTQAAHDETESHHSALSVHCSSVTMNVGTASTGSITARGQHLLASSDAAETACIACSLCTLACPACVLRLSGAATASGAYRQIVVYVHAAPRCVYCAACVDSCPVSAIDERSEAEVGGCSPPDRKCSDGVVGPPALVPHTCKVKCKS
jgi:Pyruvate/2-oxoacid:ferredoxin oxidoreductase delta subunit